MWITAQVLFQGHHDLARNVLPGSISMLVGLRILASEHLPGTDTSNLSMKSTNTTVGDDDMYRHTVSK